MKLPILSRKATPVKEPALVGLQSIVKVFADDGSAAFISVSDLDLDTDGKRDPAIKYEPTFQEQTSIDPKGEWCDSNDINFIVLPGGFVDRHGGPSMIPLGCLATVIYKDKVAHAIFADVGPRGKYGEGSIALHRALGFERVGKKGKIIDLSIEGDVTIVLYLGTRVSTISCFQSEIDAEAGALWAKFNKEPKKK